MAFKDELPRPVVAAFDFDGTITYRDSLLLFLFFTSGIGKSLACLLLSAPTLLRFVLGRIGNQSAKEALLTRFFSGMESATLDELGVRFAKHKLPQLLRPSAVARLRWHQQQGHYCVLVSASPEVYLNPWGKEMGFDAVICSRLEYDSGHRVTGRLAGDNCRGMEKVRRLREQVGHPTELYAYGDSRGDRELLAIADHAYYQHMPQPGEL